MARQLVTAAVPHAAEPQTFIMSHGISTTKGPPYILDYLKDGRTSKCSLEFGYKDA